MTRFRLIAGLVLALVLSAPPAHAARDASFLSPGPTSGGGMARSDSAITIEPKPEIDLGDVAVNVAKRTTIFFVNQTSLAINVLDVKATGDSNVEAEIVSDDCSKEKKIDTNSKCAVSVEVTPKGSGAWTAEVLMTHDGAGRLARAKLSGKTSASQAKKESEGLALSTKDIKPVDFGKVQVDNDKAVRSALMVNDSDQPITILSIEVIAAENGLDRLEQGCAEDMDLAPGESCPVTLVWSPKHAGSLSTDLIIRHSGRLGFAVIPVRGSAEEEKTKDDTKTAGTTDLKSGDKTAAKNIPLSPTAEEVEKAMAGRVEALTAPPVPSPALNDDSFVDMDGIHLIGTVGNRALLYLPGGTSKVVGVGEEIPLGGSGKIKLLNVTARQAEILLNDEKKTLSLEAVSALTSKASLRVKERSAREAVNASSKTQKASKKSLNAPPAPSESE